MKTIVLVLLVLAFVSGVVVGERRMMRAHDEQVQLLRAQIPGLEGSRPLGLPVASLMTTD